MKIQELREILQRQPNANLIDLDKIGSEVSVPQAQGKIDVQDLLDQIEVGDKHADLKWKNRYYRLRTIWGYLTIVLLGLSLGFTYWLVNGVGKGELVFTGYTAFLNIVAGTIVVNVLGLVAIVMHFLFPGEQIGKPRA